VTESAIQREIVGVGWAGTLISNRDGIVTLARARPLHAGLCTGSSDLIGWTPTLVTEEMVGRRLAVFTAIEVKSKRGSVTEEQDSFLDAVELAGGASGVARSVDQALAIVRRGGGW
jgi:hypothetical protein